MKLEEIQILITLMFMIFTKGIFRYSKTSISKYYNNIFSKYIIHGHSIYSWTCFINKVIGICMLLGHICILISIVICHGLHWMIIILLNCTLSIISWIYVIYSYPRTNLYNDCCYPCSSSFNDSHSLLFKIFDIISCKTKDNTINYHKIYHNTLCHHGYRDKNASYFINSSLLGVKMNDKFEIGITRQINNQEIPALINIENTISKGHSKGINVDELKDMRSKIIREINLQIRLLEKHIDDKAKKKFYDDSNVEELRKFVNRL